MPLESFKQLAPILCLDGVFILSLLGRVEPDISVSFVITKLVSGCLLVALFYLLCLVCKNVGEFLSCAGVFDFCFCFVLLDLLYSRKMIGFVRICIVWVVYIRA